MSSKCPRKIFSRTFFEDVEDSGNPASSPCANTRRTQSLLLSWNILRIIIWKYNPSISSGKVHIVLVWIYCLKLMLKSDRQVICDITGSWVIGKTRQWRGQGVDISWGIHYSIYTIVNWKSQWRRLKLIPPNPGPTLRESHAKLQVVSSRYQRAGKEDRKIQIIIKSTPC